MVTGHDQCEDPACADLGLRQDRARRASPARSAARGVEVLSTGGTAKALKDAGVAVTDIAEHTGFPEMMDGRLKTLHPKVHGGLLAIRGNAEHTRAAEAHGIAPIDLLVVNLYPFEATAAKGAAYDDCIENIDIGGPAMIRAAAKNHAAVTVVVDPADYARVLADMAAHGGATTPRAAQGAGGQGLRAHAPPTMRRSAAGSPTSSASARPPGAPSAAGWRRRCATARTRTSGPPSTVTGERAPRRGHRACSTRARSSPTTTSTTPTRPSSWWPSSIRRSRPPSPSSSTPIPAASRWAQTLGRGLRQGVPLRSRQRLRRHHRAQRPDRRGDGARDHRPSSPRWSIAPDASAGGQGHLRQPRRTCAC